MRKGEKWGEEGEKKERGQARELKSLVASPLYWLPRDQQGAKSTRGGGKKWMFFREREKGERKRIEMENGGVRKLRMYI